MISSCGFMHTAPVGPPQDNVDLLWKNMPTGVTIAGSFELLSVICVFYFLIITYAYESAYVCCCGV